MSRFLETSQYLRDLNALWDAHAVHIANANTSLQNMLKTVNKIPSTYISTLKKISEAQDQLSTSSSNLTKQTKKQADAMASLESKRSALLKSNKSLADAVGALEDKLKKANTQLEEMRKKSGTTSDSLKKAENNVDSLNKKLAQSSKAVNLLSGGLNATTQLMSAFGIATGLYLAVDIAQNIYKTTKELQSLDLALKMVSGTEKEFNENRIFVAAVAEKWGIEIKSLTQQYTQFYTAAKGILATEKIKTVFESIAKSGALMGLSVEKQNAAFYAFEQMMSKGVVASEELKKQLGNAMPGAMKAAGMAYMELHPKIKSIQEAEAALMKDMKAGAIDSATYVPLIVKNFEKLYGIEMVESVNTLQAAQERLINTWTEMVRAMSVADQGTVAGRTLIGMTVLANGLLEVLTNIVSTQKQINESRRDKGSSRGTSAFASDLTEFGGTTDKDRVSYAHKQMAEDLAEAQYVVEKIARIRVEMGNSILPEAMQFKLKEQLQGAYQSLGYFNARIEAAKKIITPEKLSTPVKDISGETEKERKAREAREKAIAKALEKEVRDDYEAGLSKLNHEKFLLEQKLLLKENNYSENIRIATAIGIKEQEIAKFVHDEEIRLAKDSKNKKLIADNKYAEERVKLAKSLIDRLEKVEFKPQYKDKNKVADEETYGSGVFETNKDTLANMKDAWEQQQDEKDKIAKREADRLKNMRDVLNDIFGEFGKATGFEKTMDMFGKIGKNGKTFWENLIGGKDGEITLKEGLTAGLTITQDIGNKMAESSDAHYQRELDRLESTRELSLEMVGDNAAARAKIEEDYEKKHAEIINRQAKAKKKQAMFNIAMDTAQAVMGLWVNPGFPAAIPMTIAVAALGALQLAMVASKPLPSFWTGTDNAPEGYANVDEKGPELHLDKHGKVKDFGSNKGPRVKYLSEGDKIIPAGKTADILGLNQYSSLDDILLLNNILYHDDKNNQLDTSEIVSGLDSIKRSIENKETSEEHYDERGWTKFKKINGQKIEDKNNRIRFKKSIL